MPDKTKLRNLIAGAEIEGSDCLAIIIATYFDEHPRCPDQDDDSELGWKPWVIEQTDKVLDAAVANIIEANSFIRRTSGIDIQLTYGGSLARKPLCGKDYLGFGCVYQVSLREGFGGELPRRISLDEGGDIRGFLGLREIRFRAGWMRR